MFVLEWGGDDDEIGIRDFRLSGSVEMSAGQYFAQHLFHARLDDVQMSGVGHLDHFRIDVHAEDFNAVACCYDGGGQAYVAQAHETCFHSFCLLFCLLS